MKTLALLDFELSAHDQLPYVSVPGQFAKKIKSVCEGVGVPAPGRAL